MQVQSILSCSLFSCIWLCLHGRRLKLDCDCIHSITFDLDSSFRSCRILYCKRSYIDADTSGKLRKLSSYSAQLRLLCFQLSCDQYVYCMTFSTRPATWLHSLCIYKSHLPVNPGYSWLMRSGKMSCTVGDCITSWSILLGIENLMWFSDCLCILGWELLYANTYHKSCMSGVAIPLC